MAIELKTQAEIEKMRAAGRVVHRVLAHCRGLCRPGVTTRQIDEEAYELMTRLGARGLFKNYPTYRPGEGFPANLCISINEEVVHGIAGERVVKDGDLVSLDCGVAVDGWCGDAAITVAVGQVPAPARRLCEVTKHVLDLAIANMAPGRKWSEVARLMERYAQRSGVGIVKEYVGHGIGRRMHEDPKVPNYVSPDLLKQDIVLREGMVLAIEPMCTAGAADVMEMPDGWTVRTVDGEPAAHFEHTVAVTASGVDVLTDGQ